MNDLISRAALVEKVKSRMASRVRAEDFMPGFARALLDIMDAPTIPAEVVRHGRWIHTKPEWGVDGYSRCSHCRGEVSWGQGYESQSFTHCPLCGCRMDADRESAHQKELNEKNEYNCRGFTEAERVIFNDALESVYGMIGCSMDGQGEGGAE